MVQATKATLLEIEWLRLKKKGLKNNIVAFILLILILKTSHWLGNLIWTYFQDTIDQIPRSNFVIVCGCLIHTVTAVCCFLFFLPVYVGKPSWLDQYVIKDNKKWHWKRSGWDLLRSKTLIHLVLAHFVYFPIGMYLSSQNQKIRMENFPTLTEYVCTLFFLLYTEDIFFFLTHRMFHLPWFYRNIHKQHHEYDTPFTAVSQYAHPIEYFFGNMLSSAIGISILGPRLHMFTYFMFVIIRVANTNQVHSGVEFLWSPMRFPPFSNTTSFHNFHHSKNIGVYSSYSCIWDHLTGNAVDYYRYVYGLQ